MNLTIIILATIILTISVFNYLRYRRKKATLIKAGKKWENIVKELRSRR